MGGCVRFSRRGGGLSPGHGHERVSVGGDRRRVRGGCRYRRLWSGVRHGRRSRPRGIDVLLARRVRRPKTGVTRGQGRETGAWRRRRRAVILGYNRRRRPSRPSRALIIPSAPFRVRLQGSRTPRPNPRGPRSRAASRPSPCSTPPTRPASTPRSRPAQPLRLGRRRRRRRRASATA